MARFIRSGSVLVFAVASALTLSACAGGAGAAESTGDASPSVEAIDGSGKVIDAYMFTNGANPTGQQAWFDAVGQVFTEATGAEVRFETFASGGEQLQKLQTSVVSGQGPDLYALGTSFTATAYSTGGFMTIDDDAWARLGGKDKFIPQLFGLSGPDEDTIIGIPLLMSPYVLAYNKRLLKEAGIDTLPTSWDELTADAEKATTDDSYGMAVGYADSFSPWKFIWQMNAQAGNPIVEDEQVSLDDPITTTSFDTYFGWVDSGLVSPESVSWKDADAMSAFADGKAAFMPMVTPQALPLFDASSVADEYGFAIMPTIPPGYDKRPKGGVEAASFLAGNNLAVADYSDEKELTLELVRIMTDPEMQNLQFETQGYLPSNVDVATSLVGTDENMKTILEAAALQVGVPFTPAWADIQLGIQNVVVQSIPELATGGVPPATLKTRLGEAEAAGQAALDRVK